MKIKVSYIKNNQLNPINSELESLNEKQSLLTSQYNLEISKLSCCSIFKTQKSIELSEKLKNELENVTSEVLNDGTFTFFIKNRNICNWESFRHK